MTFPFLSAMVTNIPPVVFIASLQKALRTVAFPSLTALATSELVAMRAAAAEAFAVIPEICSWTTLTSVARDFLPISSNMPPRRT